MASKSQSNEKYVMYAEKHYTTFKWRLPNYVLLQDNYKKGIMSPKFNLNGTDKKCQLSFQKNVENYPYVITWFPCSVDFHKVKIKTSIISKDGIQIWHDKAIITEPLPNTETQVPLHTQRLIPEHSIIQFPDVYLSGRALILICQISIIKNVKMASFDTVSQLPCSINDVCNKFAGFFENRSLCDVIIDVKGTVFHAHKLVLAANSPVFEAMFNTEMAENLENTVKIIDVEPRTFEVFLKCMYTGSIDNIEKHAADLLIIAEKYYVLSIKNICEDYIICHLNSANAIRYLVQAYVHGYENLKQKALAIAISSQKELVYAKNFHLLGKYPELISQIFNKPAQ